MSVAERICSKCGEPLHSEPLHNLEMGELCMSCTELADEERFQREWGENWRQYMGTGLEAIIRAAGDVCTEREMDALNALLQHNMDAKGAAAHLGCSPATLKKARDAAYAKIQAHEAVATTKLPTRRESTPRLPRHWW